LRTDPIKGRYLSATSSAVEAQIQWLERYALDASQVYYIIEDKAGERFGTVRLYDQQGVSFCWGSWILKAGTPSNFAMESALLVYQSALASGFTAAHFDVRKENESVWQFHERFGAQRISESEIDYHYAISLEAIQASMLKYKKFLKSAG